MPVDCALTREDTEQQAFERWLQDTDRTCLAGLSADEQARCCWWAWLTWQGWLRQMESGDGLSASDLRRARWVRWLVARGRLSDDEG